MFDLFAGEGGYCAGRRQCGVLHLRQAQGHVEMLRGGQGDPDVAESVWLSTCCTVAMQMRGQPGTSRLAGCSASWVLQCLVLIVHALPTCVVSVIRSRLVAVIGLWPAGRVPRAQWKQWQTAWKWQ